MKSGIYKIYFIKNNKVYVGSSVNLIKRRYEHLRTLKNQTHANRYLQRAFNKYSESAFIFEVLEECSPGDLLIREQYWIDFLDSANQDFGFNLVEDVSVGGTSGYKFSDKQKTAHRIILEQKVWNKKRKKFQFTNPSGELVQIFGLRQFCLRNNLPYRTMCNVHRGIGLSCYGWKKYFQDGFIVKRRGKDVVLTKDGKNIKTNNLKLFCQENGLKYNTIRKGYCNEGWILAA